VPDLASVAASPSVAAADSGGTSVADPTLLELAGRVRIMAVLHEKSTVADVFGCLLSDLRNTLRSYAACGAADLA
jgi:hypothetical protein